MVRYWDIKIYPDNNSAKLPVEQSFHLILKLTFGAK